MKLTKKQLLEAWPTIFDALQAMHNGLATLPGDKFVVNMASYGVIDTDTDICYGCAATAAFVHQFNGEARNAYPRYDIHNQYSSPTIGGFGQDCDDSALAALCTIESHINDVRLGYLRPMCRFYGIDPQIADDMSHDWMVLLPLPLTNENYRELLPTLQTAIDQLKLKYGTIPT